MRRREKYGLSGRKGDSKEWERLPGLRTGGHRGVIKTERRGRKGKGGWGNFLELNAYQVSGVGIFTLGGYRC